MVALSILDQSPIEQHETVQDGLKRTIELAQIADELNYMRYFVAEHHNISEVVGTSPEILVTHLLSKTERINIGSGGVMLQHYNPFKVVEQFHLMSQLAPGRVDLGVGKAPVGFPLATKALQLELQNPPIPFEEKLHLLNQFNYNSFPKDHEFKQLQTANRSNDTPKPNIFLLGGSKSSAELAAKEQVNFIFAYFINSSKKALEEAARIYKQLFPEGIFVVAAAAVVVENDADKQQVEEGRTNYRVQLAEGKSLTVNTLEQVETFRSQSSENLTVEEKKIDVINGSKQEVETELQRLVIEGYVDELMLHMPVQSHALRVKTVKQLAPSNKIINNTKAGII